MAFTLFCLSDYNFSNLTYSGLILPFVLSTMMYLSLMQFLCSYTKYALGGKHSKEGKFRLRDRPYLRVSGVRDIRLKISTILVNKNQRNAFSFIAYQSCFVEKF